MSTPFSSPPPLLLRSSLFLLRRLIRLTPPLTTPRSNSAFDAMEERLREGSRAPNPRYNLRTEYKPRSLFLDTQSSRHV